MSDVDLLPPAFLDVALATPTPEYEPELPPAPIPVDPMEPLSVPGVSPDYGAHDAWIDDPSDFKPNLDPADIVGALDREQAKKELAGSFDVLPDDVTGPRNHNQVSQEQFERIAKTYSNIRLGRTNLQIDTSRFANEEEGARYRKDVMYDFGRLMRTTTGRALIDQLAYHPAGAKTTLRPQFEEGLEPTNENTVPAHHTWPHGGLDQRIDYSKAGENLDDAGPVRPHLILAHELIHSRNNLLGIAPSGEFEPDTPHFDKGVWQHERQVIGLSRSDEPTPMDGDITENRIRYELNQVGEKWLPRWTNRVWDGEFPGEEPDDAAREAAWKEFVASDENVGI
jgi:hypothetical protein